MGHAHEHQDSGDVERYTPPAIIEAARKALGGRIILDPASCEIANRAVQAEHYFTKEQDGLSRDWFGTVWMNHPFSKGWKACGPDCARKTCGKRGYHVYEDIPSNKDWIDKLVDSYLFGQVEAACCITWANMPEAWMLPLLQFPQCFPHGRVNYYTPDGEEEKGAPKGSVITYLGPDVAQFAEAFGGIGTVKVAV